MIGPVWVSLATATVPAAALAPSPAVTQAVALSPRTFGEDDLLLLSVTLDNATLTETLGAYGDTHDPFLPIGELARLLDLDVTVSPADRRVTGTLGEARRSLTIDLASGLARSGGRDVPLGPGDVGVTPTDLYVRASTMEKLLPLRIRVDAEDLALQLNATETLPIQARAEREKRLGGLDRAKGNQRPILKVASPYTMLSAPAVDVALETGYDSLTRLSTRRYDIRVAGDLLHNGFTGYLGSDEKGHPSTARIKFDRRSPGGGLLGPLDATYAAAGDVYTPLMTVGPRSTSGRGFSFTTAALGEASVFQRITLRGELPIGYDVELYVNDVLRSGQRSPVQGRYELVDVPLSRGLNVLRIVIYGPQGDRTEQTRIINVGGGELERGKLTVEFGAIQQNRAVIELDPIADPSAGRGNGKLRSITKLAYGLTDMLTLAGGAAFYPDYDGRERKVVTIGARGSLLGLALLGDYAKDFAGGSAASFGVAGRFLGIGATARHVEYAGDFIDENNPLYDGIRALSRFSALDLNFSLPGFGKAAIPISLDAERTQFADGGTSWTGFARASTVVAKTLVSAGLDYRNDRAPDDGATSQGLTADLAASRYFAFKWQIRAVANLDITPRARLNGLSVTADRDLSDITGLRLGVGRSFGTPKDFDAQAGLFFRLPFGDLSATGDYAVKSGWRVGLRLAFGLVRDPFSGRARLTRPGVASGGSVAFAAFMDRNNDGRYEPGEPPVPGIELDGGERRLVTDKDGRAFVTGLGDSATASLHANLDKIDAFMVSSPPEDIEFSPRPGKVLAIPYAINSVGEVFAHVWLTVDGKRTGLAAVRVRLVRGGADPIPATTEYDGSVLFENVRPGTYRLTLDPEQAQRLHMRLVAEPTVTVKEDGTATEANAEVRFGAGDAP
jgi:hypothetical protein